MVNSTEPLLDVPVIFIANQLVVTTALDLTNTSFLGSRLTLPEDLPNPGYIPFNVTALDLAGNPSSLLAVTSGVPVTFGTYFIFGLLFEIAFLLCPSAVNIIPQVSTNISSNSKWGQYVANVRICVAFDLLFPSCSEILLFAL
jgi:hypothetical protein